MTNVTVIVLALASAAAAAASSVLQHRSARTAPHSAGHRLLGYLLTRPAWLAGGLAGIAGLAFHALALTRGNLAIVQPLLISGVLFALPASVALEGRRLSLREWRQALMLVAGLTIFLFAAHPRPGWINVDTDVLATLTASCVGLAALASVVGFRFLRRHRAVLLGIAAGVGYGVSAALLKQSVVIGRHGIERLLTGWPGYAFIALGIASVVLTQLAYRAGPLAGSMPAVTLSDPAISVIIGAIAFHELIAHSPGALVAQAIGLVLTIAAVAQLSKAHPKPVPASA